jgi:hypothetical protein
VERLRRRRPQSRNGQLSPPQKGGEENAAEEKEEGEEGQKEMTRFLVLRPQAFKAFREGTI